jgi:hypothetical protein
MQSAHTETAFPCLEVSDEAMLPNWHTCWTFPIVSICFQKHSVQEGNFASAIGAKHNPVDPLDGNYLYPRKGSKLQTLTWWRNKRQLSKYYIFPATTRWHVQHASQFVFPYISFSIPWSTSSLVKKCLISVRCLYQSLYILQWSLHGLHQSLERQHSSLYICTPVHTARTVLFPVCTSLFTDSLSLWLYSPSYLGRFFSFLVYKQSVGLIGLEISPSQGATYIQNNTNTE